MVWKRGGRKSIFEGVGTEAGYEDKNRNEDKELLGPTLRGLCWSSLKKKVEGRQQEQDQWDQSYIGYKRVMLSKCLNR